MASDSYKENVLCNTYGDRVIARVCDAGPLNDEQLKDSLPLIDQYKDRMKEELYNSLTDEQRALWAFCMRHKDNNVERPIGTVGPIVKLVDGLLP